MKHLKDFPSSYVCHGGYPCNRFALRDILLTATVHQCKYSLYPRLCPELYRQFLPYRILHVRQKAVMEQGVRFWRSTFIQLPAAHRFAEYIPLVGTLQNPCPYSGIRHSHSGQFPVGTLRFQTKRLIFLKSIILIIIFIPDFSGNNIFAKYLPYTLAK